MTGEAVVMESLKNISDSLQALVSHNQSMSERLVTQENNYNHLAKSIDRLSESSEKVVIAVGQLTVENQNLKKHIIKEIEDVKVLQEKQSAAHSKLADRVTNIEIARAEQRGAEKVEQKVSDRVWEQWFNVGKVLGAIVTILAALFAGSKLS